ncbi:ATP-binding protein [Streptomyces sp. NBC_01537]|uniref:ATP-binding protein n=1 Tax=Streptomyces sp. NBC_01537 TaxID=2903896 RepID=UPI00386A7BDD
MMLPTARERLLPLTDSRRDVLRLPAQAASVGVVRRQVRATLSRWALDRVGDDACLVVTELFTNAVLHSGSDHVTCALWTGEGLLHIEVTDQGDRAAGPAMRRAGDGEENGRGLVLVSHLAQQWGVVHPGSGAGRTVWAALACGGVPLQKGARRAG